MRRFALLTALFVPMLIVALLPGCGGKSTSSNLTPGDTTSADFQFVQSFLGDGVQQSIISALDLTFILWDSIPGVSASPRDHYRPMALQTGDSLSLNYNYADGWHVFSFEMRAEDETDTVVMTGIDSVRFLSNGEPMQVPDSTADALDIRPHFTLEAYVNGSSMSTDQALSVTNLTNDMLEPVTVNGSSVEAATLIFADSVSSCTLAMGTHLTLNNIVTVLDGASCPTSGSLHASATIDMSCTGDGGNAADVNGSWYLTATYNGTTATMQYSNETTVWNVTEPCGDPVVKLFPWFFPRQ